MLAALFLGEGIVAWNAFGVVRYHGVSGLWPAQLTFALLLAAVMGTAPAMLAEQFRPRYRVSAHAVTFNIGIGVAGGTAPLIAVGLIKASGEPMAPAVYLILAAMLALAGVLALEERSREEME